SLDAECIFPGHYDAVNLRGATLHFCYSPLWFNIWWEVLILFSLLKYSQKCPKAWGDLSPRNFIE
ncbi:hypothetical protein BZK42_21275, partial [Citrobacter braakii]